MGRGIDGGAVPSAELEGALAAPGRQQRRLLHVRHDLDRRAAQLRLELGQTEEAPGHATGRPEARPRAPTRAPLVKVPFQLRPLQRTAKEIENCA